jgi:hypothetical protein
MFGFEVLDIVIGLMFVYLLLSLLATALNEYLSALMNLRGKELARGLSELLDDVDEKGAVKRALDGLAPDPVKTTTIADSLTERLYNHRLIRPLATRRGKAFFFRKTPRLPSYIPARTFALALLDLLGVRDDAATIPPAGAAGAAGAAGGAGQPPIPPELARVLNILKRESPYDVNQALSGLLGNATLPASAKVRLTSALSASQTQLQNLHDSVEVWFNNSMDRVTGAYKRNVQGILFLLGVLIASCSNADTIDMWHRLASNDELRTAMAKRAAAYIASDTTTSDTSAADTTVKTSVTPPAAGGTAVTRPAGTDTTSNRPPATNPTPAPAGGTAKPDSARTGTTGTDTAAVRKARDKYLAARSELDSMELKLGWTAAEAIRVGLVRKDDSVGVRKAADRRARTGAQPLVITKPKQADSVKVNKNWVPAGYHVDWFPIDSKAGFLKLLGLLMTAIAISLGAPFWFDMLNKVISIRSAGRSPSEKPKSPEGRSTRPAEHEPR